MWLLVWTQYCQTVCLPFKLFPKERGSKINTFFLHMISRRQTTQRTWKVQNLEQRLNYCGKNCQSAKHELVDKATAIYPPTSNYWSDLKVCFVSFHISPVLNSNRSLFLKCQIWKLDFAKIIKSIFQFSSFASIYSKFVSYLLGKTKYWMALNISCTWRSWQWWSMLNAADNGWIWTRVMIFKRHLKVILDCAASHVWYVILWWPVQC